MSIYSEYKNVQELLGSNHPVIFYAESRNYHQYFRKLIDDVINLTSLPVCYITSDKEDPLLAQSSIRFQVVYVRFLLGFLFPRLNANVVIMTMPDLDNFLFKRSKQAETYVYIFHAAVSTHQQYRKKAFFNYDAVFCTGSYQVLEIKAAEEKYDLKVKDIIPYGYPLFDWIYEEYIHASEKRNENRVKTILIAPSWYEHCIFETCLEELIQHLASSDYKIIIRSHPEYKKRRRKKYRELQKLLWQKSNVSIDESPDVFQSLIDADVLITDRSGIAFEYAFGTNRPVLFIDTELKSTNSDWKELGIEPIENNIRSKIGISMLPGEIPNIHEKLLQLNSLKEKFPEQIQQMKKHLFFNSPDSYNAGVEYITNKVRNG